MIDFTIYDLKSGQIKRIGSCFYDPVNDALADGEAAIEGGNALTPNYIVLANDQCQDGEGVIEGHYNQSTIYILTDAPTPRPLQLTVLDKLELTANGVDSVLISNAPEGIFSASNIVTNESVSGIISGNDEFMTTVKGCYKLTIIAFPFLDFEATINAI